jgi:hypothetical protein
MIGGIIVMFAIILIAIATYCICKNWKSKKEKKKKKTNSSNHPGEQENLLESNSTNGHRRNSLD